MGYILRETRGEGNWPLRAGEWDVGRRPQSAIRLYDRSVSRTHARIIVEGDRAMIEDLGSHNGTRVNGRATGARTPLRDSDRIQLGGVELQLVDAGRAPVTEVFARRP